MKTASNLDVPLNSIFEVLGFKLTSKEALPLSTDIQLDTRICLLLPLATAGENEKQKLY
jgi:hypothetical protein